MRSTSGGQCDDCRSDLGVRIFYDFFEVFGHPAGTVGMLGVFQNVGECEKIRLT